MKKDGLIDPETAVEVTMEYLTNYSPATYIVEKNE